MKESHDAMFTNTNFAQMFIFENAREIAKARKHLIIEKEYYYIDLMFSSVSDIYNVFQHFLSSVNKEYEQLNEEINKKTNGEFIHTGNLDSKELKQVDENIMNFYRCMMSRLGSAGLISPYYKKNNNPAFMDE